MLLVYIHMCTCSHNTITIVQGKHIVFLFFSAAVEKIQQQFQSHNITTVHTTMSER